MVSFGRITGYLDTEVKNLTISTGVEARASLPGDDAASATLGGGITLYRSGAYHCIRWGHIVTSSGGIRCNPQTARSVENQLREFGRPSGAFESLLHLSQGCAALALGYSPWLLREREDARLD